MTFQTYTNFIDNLIYYYIVKQIKRIFIALIIAMFRRFKFVLSLSSYDFKCRALTSLYSVKIVKKLHRKYSTI